ALLLNADPELAFAAAMLQDFLLPRLTTELYSPYLRFTTEPGERTLPEFETQELGWDHALAAATFMRRWNFPDDLVVCVLLHHRGLGIFSDPHLAKSAAAAVAVSALLPEQMRQVPRGIEHLQKLAANWPRFDLLAIADRVSQQSQEMSPGPVDDQSIMR